MGPSVLKATTNYALKATYLRLRSLTGACLQPGPQGTPQQHNPLNAASMHGAFCCANHGKEIGAAPNRLTPDTDTLPTKKGSLNAKYS